MASTSSISPISSGEIYGLGIRLGLYLHYVSLFLLRVSGYGSWASLRRIRTSCLLICFIISVKICIDLFNSRCIPPDFLITFYLVVVLFLQDSYNLYEKRNEPETGYRYQLQPDIILFLQNLLCLAASCIAAWYWIDGINHVQSRTDDTKAALVGMFSPYETTWRRIAAAFAIITAIGFLILCFSHSSAFHYHDRVPVRDYRQYMTSKKHAHPAIFPESKASFFGPVMRPKFPATAKITQACREKQKKIPKVLLFLVLRLAHWSAMQIGCPVIATVSVERMIRANHLLTGPVSGSTGQMLILAIGIGNLVALLKEMISDYWLEIHKSPSRGISGPLIMHMYYSSRPLDEAQMETTLGYFLWSAEHWKHVPGLFVKNKWKDSLASLLRKALLRELVKELQANTKANNGAPAPIERYREIKAIEKMDVHHSREKDHRGVALCQAAAHGHHGILQMLVDDFDDYGGYGKWRRFFFPGEGKEGSSIMLPIPQSVDGIMRLCQSVKFAEYAAIDGYQWELSSLLESYHKYLMEQAAQYDRKSDVSSTATTVLQKEESGRDDCSDPIL